MFVHVACKRTFKIPFSMPKVRKERPLEAVRLHSFITNKIHYFKAKFPTFC